MFVYLLYLVADPTSTVNLRSTVAEIAKSRPQISESVLSSCKTLAAHRDSVAWNLTLFATNIKKNDF